MSGTSPGSSASPTDPRAGFNPTNLDQESSGQMLLGQTSSPEVKAAAPWCLLVPLGATEQHGPHLPLATDTIIAQRWAQVAASRVHGVMVAPCLPYGSSGEHQGFPGTISIGQSALHQVVVEIARSVQRDYRAIVFVSGHGGNVPVLRPAVEQLRSEGHVAHWISPHWDDSIDTGADDLGVVDAHAGLTETSMMLHLQPDLVDTFEGVEGNRAPLDELMPRLRVDGLAAVSDSGVLGDPSGATAAHGEVRFSSLVTTLVHQLQQLRTNN